jgi:hypothetical protein
MHLYPHQLDEQMLGTKMKSHSRHLSMPSNKSFVCENAKFDNEEQPLRVHVGNIPFLWTIDDLRKQFLVRKKKEHERLKK